MYLLDTNAISEMRKRPGRRDSRVEAWFGSVDHRSLILSVMTLMELEQGVLKMERRDADQGIRFRRWYERVVTDFDSRILVIDPRVAAACARLNVPDQRPYRDGLIAATALVHGLTVVTRDSDFALMDVPLLNPWEWEQTGG